MLSMFHVKVHVIEGRQCIIEPVISMNTMKDRERERDEAMNTSTLCVCMRCMYSYSY